MRAIHSLLVSDQLSTASGRIRKVANSFQKRPPLHRNGSTAGHAPGPTSAFVERLLQTSVRGLWRRKDGGGGTPTPTGFFLVLLPALQARKQQPAGGPGGRAQPGLPHGRGHDWHVDLHRRRDQPAGPVQGCQEAELRRVSSGSLVGVADRWKIGSTGCQDQLHRRPVARLPLHRRRWRHWR